MIGLLRALGGIVGSFLLAFVVIAVLIGVANAPTTGPAVLLAASAAALVYVIADATKGRP